MRFLVTAGNTREPIDQVRDWGNIFTGNTGYAIATALAELGPVDLLTSNRAHLAELAGEQQTAHRIAGEAFLSHAQLKKSLEQAMRRERYSAVFMSAAVADYRPAGAYAVLERRVDDADVTTEHWVVRSVQAGKVKGNHPSIAILGEPTQKLVDLFRSAWDYRGILVKFKLEVGLGVDELLRIGENSRLASGADYLVANTLEMVSGPTPGAYLLWHGGREWVGRADLPQRMVRIVKEATKREEVQ